MQHCQHTRPTVLRADSLQVTLADIRSIRIPSSTQQDRYFIFELLLQVVQVGYRFSIIAMIYKLEDLLEVPRSWVCKSLFSQYLRIALTLQERSDLIASFLLECSVFSRSRIFGCPV